MNDLLIILPELAVLTLSCLILVIDLYLPKKARGLTYLLTQVTLLVGAGLCLYPMTSHTLAFAGHFSADLFAQTLKVFILGTMFVVLLYSRSYVHDRHIARGEYHLLALFSTLGMMCMVSAKTTLMIYLGLELFSLPVYTLVALHRDNAPSVEAGMKYFVTGALASGMLLYGISILYGMTGTLELGKTAEVIAAADGLSRNLCAFGLVFIVAGIAFKFGAVPFHMWLPDVYEGAPTSVTLLIGSAPKLAAFGMAYRLLAEAAPSLADYGWREFLMILTILSLSAGNIIAIAQTNIKRMLAYSTIAHVGFILLGFIAGPVAGYDAAMFYTIVYAITAACAFGMIILLSRKGFEAENITDFKGLGQRSPWLAFLMLLTMFSFTGVPPTVGFYAKFLVLNALVESNFVWLAAVAVFFSIIGAFYYLRVVKVMYFDTIETPKAVPGDLDLRMVLSVNGLAILALGIFPAPLFVLCQQALAAL